MNTSPVSPSLLLDTLKHSFGYQSFRPGQVEIIPIDVEMHATVDDLHEAIKQVTGIAFEFEMSVNGQVLNDKHAMLADSGVSSYADIQVHPIEPHFMQMQRFLFSLGDGNEKFQELQHRVAELEELYLQTGNLTKPDWSSYEDGGYYTQDGKITEIVLYDCGLGGSLSLSDLPATCEDLRLEVNRFVHIKDEVPRNARLERIGLNHNIISGNVNRVLRTLFQFESLSNVELRDNRLNGTLDIQAIAQWRPDELIMLQLFDNCITDVMVPS